MANVSCKKCGREVASAARWCPDCRTIMGETVKCRACGNDVPKIPGKGCPHCGADRLGAYGSYGLGGLFFFVSFAVLSCGLIGFFSCRDQEDRKRKDQEWERKDQEWRQKHGFDP